MCDAAAINVIEDCAARSHAGTIDFATVVAKLAAAGVESYHADYRRGETTYYSADGTSHVVRLLTPAAPIAEVLDVLAVQEAVRGAQRGEVKYVEFMDRTMHAGCIGYIVWISGRHVQYLGRRGEVHTERFPSIT